MQNKNIIWTICVTFIVSLLFAMIFSHVKHDEKLNKKSGRFLNTIYEDLVTIGGQHNLDMSFTKYVQNERYLEIENNDLFQAPKKSYDVLFFGDSTIALGLMPSVIEQMTGLKVGMFAYESFGITHLTTKVVQNIASYYLKDDGLIIIAFAHWTQGFDVFKDDFLYRDWLISIANMTKKEYAEYCESKQKGAVDKLSYRNIYEKVKTSLGKYYFSLPDNSLYFEYIEPYINPEWHKVKTANSEKLEKETTIKQLVERAKKAGVNEEPLDGPDEGEKKSRVFIRWDNNSVSIIETNPTKSIPLAEVNKSINMDISPYENAKSASQIIKALPYQKAYLINLVNSNNNVYTDLNMIYENYYKDFCKKIDLMEIQPPEGGIEMQDQETAQHMVNAGGLYQSIFIAQWLKKNLSE